jgi:hypothetical protein
MITNEPVLTVNEWYALVSQVHELIARYGKGKVQEALIAAIRQKEADLELAVAMRNKKGIKGS